MAVATMETIEGLFHGGVHCHYDVPRDVLYLRLNDKRDIESYSEDSDDGLTYVRDWNTNEIVGLTVISFWERFGKGELRRARLEEVEAAIEKMARRLTLEERAAVAV